MRGGGEDGVDGFGGAAGIWVTLLGTVLPGALVVCPVEAAGIAAGGAVRGGAVIGGAALVVSPVGAGVVAAGVFGGITTTEGGR